MPLLSQIEMRKHRTRSTSRTAITFTNNKNIQLPRRSVKQQKSESGKTAVKIKHNPMTRNSRQEKKVIKPVCRKGQHPIV